MRVTVIHNLPPGGARRRLSNQMRHFTNPVTEICLATATPIQPDATVISFRQSSEMVPRGLRPPLRYVDQLLLERAWGRVANVLASTAPDVVYLNPCRFLQAPPLPLERLPPVVYFCDEPRRVDHEPSAAASRNPVTTPIYRAIYARQRTLDERTTRGVATIATNSRYTAGEIEQAYGRTAQVVRMGVADTLTVTGPILPRPRFVLSVGALVSGKGHDLVVGAAARSVLRPAVEIVAPRPDDAEASRLDRLARELGVTLTISVGIPDAQLSALYRSALATVYLARREPLGLVSIEAQAHGCPVIVAAEGGLPETVLEDETGWSCPRDAAAAASLIDRLSDDELRGRMSDAARRYGLTWTWKASALQIETLLTDAISGDAPS